MHDLGVTQPLFCAMEKALSANAQDTVLDVGAGDGFYLGNLAAATNCTASGVDISITAMDAAARRYRECEWIVANADRFIPYAEHSFSVLISITGRMNPDEFWRVLKPDGKLLIAIPAPDDLIELRGEGRDRVTRTVELFASRFRLMGQQRTTTTAQLNEAAIENILLSIYRPMQLKRPEAMRVTLSLDLLLFELTEGR